MCVRCVWAERQCLCVFLQKKKNRKSRNTDTNADADVEADAKATADIIHKHKMQILQVFLGTLLCGIVLGANILAVFPSVWKSHYLFGRRLLQELVESSGNHSVTLISPHAAQEGVESEIPKIRELRIEGLRENWLDMGMSFEAEEMRAQSVMERFTRLIYAGTTNVDILLSDPQVRKLLTSGEKFDLLIVDLFLSDALLG